jgi:DNA-binding transcriptional ArsR family regulator
MPRKFRVVKTNDPAVVFDDLDALREVMPAVATKRARSTETFARFPHERTLGLRGRIGADAWILLIEIDRLILKGRGRNPIRLTNHRLRELGISRSAKQRHLRQLEVAGVVKVQTEGRKWTVVTHLWFPVQT